MSTITTLGGETFASYSVTVQTITGLFDFPTSKIVPHEFGDQDFADVSTRQIDTQFNSRIITMDCFITGNSWTDAKLKIDLFMNFIFYDGLKMLVCPDRSTRGYMVRVAKTTIFEPQVYFDQLKNCIVKFKLIFEEPQPFNVQFTLKYTEPGRDMPIYFKIEDATATPSIISNDQEFITVNCFDTTTEVNLKDAPFIYSALGGIVYANDIFPIVITGEIDKISDITITQPDFADIIVTGEGFLRNGTITIVEP